MGFLYILGVPLGYAIYYIHSVVRNYGLSIVVFTILLKVLLTPIYIKQQKSAARMSAFNPLINEINRKYRNNAKKRSEELQQLYLNNNMNPGASFLPMLLQIFVLFGMMDVVYRPLTHILQFSSGVIDKALEIFKVFEPSFFSRGAGSMIQINLINDVIANPNRYESLGSNFIESVRSINLNFLGFNLGKPADLISYAILIPIFSLVFSFLQTLIMTKQNSATPATGVLKFFMFVMPCFSCFITLVVPIGVSVYWIVSYILQVFQSLFLNKMCNFEQIRRNAILEFEQIRKNKKNRTQTGNKAKISNNSRLNLARKKLTDRYGD